MRRPNVDTFQIFCLRMSQVVYLQIEIYPQSLQHPEHSKTGRRSGYKIHRSHEDGRFQFLYRLPRQLRLEFHSFPGARARRLAIRSLTAAKRPSPWRWTQGLGRWWSRCRSTTTWTCRLPPRLRGSRPRCRRSRDRRPLSTQTSDLSTRASSPSCTGTEWQ